MNGIIHRHWLRLLGRKRFPQALIFGDVHPDANIGDGVWIPYATRVDSSCNIGRYSYIMPPCHLHSVTIGNFCSIGEGCSFLSTQHNPAAFSTFPFARRLAMHNMNFPAMFEESINRGPIEIGHDVWIGANSTIMGGISIGTGAIVGAGAVVTKDVAPYSVVAGVPARVISNRFDDATIEKLLESNWWEWPLDEIQARHHELTELIGK